MTNKWIKNWDELATSENRKLALEIAEAGFEAINTEKIIDKSIKLENNSLSINGESFDLSKFKRIKVVGFGKASSDAATALSKILGNKIKAGVVIDIRKVAGDYIETFAGTHPRPSKINLIVGKKISDIVKFSKEDDLIIVIVSGGGSALLCSTEDECEQGIKLYDLSLELGLGISEMNTIRKHFSPLKGGGLAELAYPATVIGLIFSDIPGNNFANVASGPTYKDETTIHDVEEILQKHNLGEFILNETPKDDKYFKKVHNFVLVSNKTAIEAMAKKSEGFGFKATVISTELYDELKEAIRKIFSMKENNTVALVAGEPSVLVGDKGGKGGRNLHMALTVLGMKIVDENSVFMSLASDGMDNGDFAGAIIDKNTIEKAEKSRLDIDDYLRRFDSYSFFQKIGDMVITGPTGANVSDFMILLNNRAK
jgi:glycerate-2-kinase